MGQQVRIGLENSNPIVCEKCGNDTFKEATYLRRISKILTASSEDSIVPVPTFACAKCNHVNEQFQLQDAKPATPESTIIS